MKSSINQMLLSAALAVYSISADTPVSVCGDATYSIADSYGPVCSGNGLNAAGTACPMFNDVAIDHCVETLHSFNNGSCTAFEPAVCQHLESGAWGCVFPSTGCGNPGSPPTGGNPVSPPTGGSGGGVDIACPMTPTINSEQLPPVMPENPESQMPETTLPSGLANNTVNGENGETGTPGNTQPNLDGTTDVLPVQPDGEVDPNAEGGQEAQVGYPTNDPEQTGGQMGYTQTNVDPNQQQTGYPTSLNDPAGGQQGYGTNPMGETPIPGSELLSNNSSPVGQNEVKLAEADPLSAGNDGVTGKPFAFAWSNNNGVTQSVSTGTPP